MQGLQLGLEKKPGLKKNKKKTAQWNLLGLFFFFGGGA